MNVPFTIPSFAGDAPQAVVDVLRSGWWTTGPNNVDFEKEFAAYLGAGHVLAVSSCTAALELCLHALDLPEGSPVFTPSLTFCGAVAAIVHAGHTPVYVDVDEDTLVISPETVAQAVRTHGRPAALCVNHMAGYPVDVPALAEAAGLPRTRVVEDVAHGPGGMVNGRHAGADSYAACYSFYATKNLPMGEGGAIATFDEEFALRLRALRLHGMSKDAWKRYLPGGSWRYDVREPGFKANLTDFQAAIGRAALRAFPEWQERRAKLVAQYDAALADLVRLPRRPEEPHAWHLYIIRVSSGIRDEIIADLSEAGVATSVHFIPAHHLTAYKHLPGADELPVTDRLGDELLSLPLYPALADSDQGTVVSALADALTRRGATR